MKTRILLGLMLVFFSQPLFADDTVGSPGGIFISQFLNEGSTLTRRSKVNWTGAGVDCVDNSGLRRTDCTVSSVGSSGLAPAFAVNNNGVLVSSPTSTINLMTPFSVALQGSTTAQVTLQKISLSTAVTGTLDISTQTNLAVTNPIILTGDTLSLSLISLSTSVVGPLLISSGTITQFYSSTITFADGTQQYTAAPAAAGDITSVTAGTGLTGGGLSGGVTLNVDPTYTGFIWNTASLQTGATAYPFFLTVGTAGAVIHGNTNIDGIITASNTAITTAAGLLDATKITGTVPNASIDNSSVTKMGNVFNTADHLLQLDSSADVPDANLSANVSLLGSSIDISAETNLGATYPLAMSGDNVIVSTGGLLISTSSLQSGTTFFVSSGTVNTQLNLPYLSQGAIAFVGAGGAISGDSSNFVYDSVNHAMGIGTSSPQYAVQFTTSIGASDDIKGFGIGNTNLTNTGRYRIFDVLNGPTPSVTARFGYRTWGVELGVFDNNGGMILGSVGNEEEFKWDTANTRFHIGDTVGIASLNVSGNAIFGANIVNTSTPPTNGLMVEGYTALLSSCSISDSLSVSSTASFSGALIYLATSPAVFSSSKNDYAVGLPSVVRSSASTAVNITGFAGGADGKQFEFVNVGTTTITLQNENASSSAANRIITATGSDDPVTTKGSRRLWYDAITTRWRIIQ